MKQGLIYLLALMMMTGCTVMLWDEPLPPTAKASGYHAASGYYVGSDNNLLLIRDQRKNNYIFDITTSFKEILLLDRKLKFQAVHKNFKVDEANIITGNLELFIDLPENSFTANKLKKLGFVRTEKGLNYQTQLIGKLYELETNFRVVSEENSSLVITEQGEFSVAEKILLSPFTILVDTLTWILLIEGVVLMIILSVFG